MPAYSPRDLLTHTQVAEGTFEPVKPAAGRSWPVGGSVGSGWGDSHKASLPEPEHFLAYLSLMAGVIECGELLFS